MMDFYQRNRQHLLAELPEDSLTIIFAGKYKQRSEDDELPFTANRNYYYLTGLKNVGGVLILTKTWTMTGEHLFVDRPTARKEMYKGPFPSNDEYSKLTGIRDIHYIDELDTVVGHLLQRHGYNVLFADLQRYVFDGTRDLPQAFAARFSASYPHVEIKSIRPILCNMRRVKTAEEQELLRQAGRYTVEAVCDVAKHIKPGVWTYSLYSQFNYYLGYHYGEGPSFASVISTGKDCLALHCFETFGELKDGELVLVDVGAECQYYASDICRMYPVNGKFTEEQRYFYQAVIDAEEAVAAELRPGFNMKDIPAVADAVLIDRMRKAGLLDKDEEIRRYLDHGIYHFVGLDAHDVGEECVLRPGMVISIEPGLYIPEKGIGVRVEDNFLITEYGHEVLTKDLPKLPDDIEAQLSGAGDQGRT